jgi:hypothetical protein
VAGLRMTRKEAELLEAISDYNNPENTDEVKDILQKYRLKKGRITR